MSDFNDLGIGLGLRVPHIRHILQHQPQVDVFEIISENFLVDGGLPMRNLAQIKERYPIVMHGVSMGIASADPIDNDHLQRVKALTDYTNSPWVSEHLCWTKSGNAHLHDLLPVPHTEAVADFIAEKAKLVQGALGRPLALENLSSYVGFASSTMPEWEFYRRVLEQADCAAMLDVNNIFVSSVNHDFDPMTYLDAVPWERVAQVHVAGHTVLEDGSILDTHDHTVRPEVWHLYAIARERCGAVTTILERDDDIPDFPTTLAEAELARTAVAQLS